MKLPRIGHRVIKCHRRLEMRSASVSTGPKGLTDPGNGKGGGRRVCISVWRCADTESGPNNKSGCLKS
jgi:hypothetical protein